MKRISAFVGLTFLFSWAAWLPVVVAELHTTETAAGSILFFIGGFGPSIVGTVFLLTSRDFGGLRELLSRTFSFRRIPMRTLVPAVLAYPALFLGVSVVFLLFGGNLPEFGGFAGLFESAPALVGGILLTLFLGPLSEEIGWRGFMLPLVQSRRGALVGSLVVGLVWWAWHIPLFFMDGTLHATQGFFSAFSIGYLITVVSYSVFFTWLYNQTKSSIWIAVIAHFSINMMISGSSPFDGTIFAILSFVLLAAAVVLVIVRPKLARHSAPNV